MFSVVAAGLPLAAVGIASGDTLFDEGRSLEFRTDLAWSRLQLEGREQIDGVSPLRVPGPLSGKFWLSAWGPGVELQRGRVDVDLDDGGSGILSYGRRGVPETLLYSILYPGIIQYGQGQQGKGIYLGALATAGLVGSVVTEAMLWNARDDLEAAERAYYATTLASEQHQLANVRQDRREERDRAVDRRTIMLIGTGAVWGVSLLDATLFSPDFRVARSSADGLTLGMRPKTRAKALARSLLFPGLGQEYNGESTKAAWVGTGAVAAGLWLMYRQDQYAESAADYNKAHRRFVAATTVEEREYYSALQQNRYSRVVDRQRDRNLAIGILGGYWGIAALETVLSFGESWGDLPVRGTEVGLTVDPMEGAVAAQWKF